MGSNTTQGIAITVFLLAFTALAMSMFGGGFLYVVLFLAGLGGSIALFLKAKPLENVEP